MSMDITNRTAFDKKEYSDQMQAQNRFGEWMPAIPEPFHLTFRKQCISSHGNLCGMKFWSYEAYRAHFALVHILGY